MPRNQKIIVGGAATALLLCALCSCLALGFALGRVTGKPKVIYKPRLPLEQPQPEKPWEFFRKFQSVPVIGQVVEVRMRELNRQDR